MEVIDLSKARAERESLRRDQLLEAMATINCVLDHLGQASLGEAGFGDIQIIVTDYSEREYRLGRGDRLAYVSTK